MKRILVTGGSGFLGSHAAWLLSREGFEVSATYGKHPDRFQSTFGKTQVQGLAMDLTSDVSIADAFRTANPHAVVHTAAAADPGPCQENPGLARRVNVDATETLARLSKTAGARFVFFSTDQVFDGERGGYCEADPPHPIHVYGETKVEAERRVLDLLGGRVTVMRITLAYGRSPTGDRSCTEQVLCMLERGESPRLFIDEIRCPVLAEDVGQAVLELLASSEEIPILHLGGPEALSRYDIGKAAAEAFGHDPSLLQAVRQSDLKLPAPRPRDLSVDTGLAQKILKRPPRTFKKGIEWLASG
ncbi:MAG: SDR family oxidoreductase [Planctomycetota bacterium]|jgi:dTDP-4-dehydrorhamnose reductase